MGRLLFLLFLAVPLIEIAFFVVIGNAIGLWPTLAGVVVTAIVGSVLLRSQGLTLLAEIQATMARRRLPARALADAMLVGIGGILLLLPGYVSDLIGILLLIPPVRAAIYAVLVSRMTRMPVATGTSYGWRPDGPGANSNDRGGDRSTIDLESRDWRER